MENTEEDRLKLVREFNNLDFNNNKELKEIVKFVSEICETPIAMVTLMEHDIQWIRISTVPSPDSNTRENSFCRYLADSNSVMVVNDALEDIRFINNPLVLAYGLRFYAGAPLITKSGYQLGSLCVFDQQPREFTEQQKTALSILSRQVINLMELQMGMILLEQQKQKTELSERKLRAFFNSSESCHILIDKNLEVVDFNKATSCFFKTKNHKKICNGTNILDYVTPSYQQEFLYGFKKALKGRPNSKEILINYGAKHSIWWNISFAPVKDEEGTINYVSYNATNINDNKNYMQEITMQNESLKNIAYIQSHEYRKPVSSILGLMGIISNDNYEPNKECLLMMEEAVNDLDEKIRSVVGATETVIVKKASLKHLPVSELAKAKAYTMQ